MEKDIFTYIFTIPGAHPHFLALDFYVVSMFL